MGSFKNGINIPITIGSIPFNDVRQSSRADSAQNDPTSIKDSNKDLPNNNASNREISETNGNTLRPQQANHRNGSNVVYPS
jgi:hypothetical protein